MELKTFRHLWGVTAPLADFLEQISSLGYAGIEMPVAQAREDAGIREWLTRPRNSFIAMIFTEGASVAEHLRSFEAQLAEAAALDAVLVNSHSGADSFPVEDAEEFFRGACKIERGIGIPVAHETHRGRILFNPWITDHLLKKVPGWNVCADLSHWVCVCERLLTHEEAIVRRVADRTIHLHARVGFEQGPQVPDPRAPEYAAQVAAHEAWWDIVWDAQEARGMEITMLTPEFGPPPYLPTMPFTQQPLADLAEVCEWQARRQCERFARRSRG